MKIVRPQSARNKSKPTKAPRPVAALSLGEKRIVLSVDEVNAANDLEIEVMAVAALVEAAHNAAENPDRARALVALAHKGIEEAFKHSKAHAGRMDNLWNADAACAREVRS